MGQYCFALWRLLSVVCNAAGGRAAAGPSAWTVGRPTLYAGTVRLRPVRATPWLIKPELWSTNVDYHQCCWWRLVLLRQYAILDANHRGRRTQIFGSKKSKPETSRRSTNAIFTNHTCSGHPRWNFVVIFCVRKLEPLGYRWLHDPTFSHFGRVLVMDKHAMIANTALA